MVTCMAFFIALFVAIVALADAFDQIDQKQRNKAFMEELREQEARYERRLAELREERQRERGQR